MDRFLSGKEVCDLLNISRVTRWRHVKDGVLPPPRVITPNGHGKWKESEIEEILNSAPIADAYKNCKYRGTNQDPAGPGDAIPHVA